MIGAAVPTVTVAVNDPIARLNAVGDAIADTSSTKCTPLDLKRYFTASSKDFGPRARARELGRGSEHDGYIRTPGGAQVFRGIPFLLGSEDAEAKSWIILTTRPTSWAKSSIEIPLEQKADFVCLAAFCDWDENEMPPPNVEDTVEKVGERLADAVWVYEDGHEHALPIRRRFEVNSPSTLWGHLSFASVPHLREAPRKLTEPLPHGTEWGDLQTTVWDVNYPSGPWEGIAIVWLSALANPEPARTVKALRLEANSDSPLIVCGLTLFRGRENPLRYDRASLYRVTLPEPDGDEDRWKVALDLGVVARSYLLNGFDPASWLVASGAGLGERASPNPGARYLYIEVAASPEARLILYDTRAGTEYEFDLSQAVPGRELAGRPRGASIEILEREKVWLHGQVIDAITRRPTPVRLAFRSKEGRYIPPYGHRTEVNAGWFQDYGADVKLGDSSFAIVDGTFQVELPVGEAYLEMSKGFEYQAVRKKLNIAPGQRALVLEINRMVDFRSQGWACADTHVHFLSPSTAVLEGQAEGLNLINLLAAQWGDLFSNVGDLFQGPLTSRDGETIVWPGTENRQHILGHLGLLGGHGAPVYPMSASGPEESYLGDPLWTSLADWADECRKRQGLVVAVHFPYPTAELAADIVLGKIDALEIRPGQGYFNTLRFLDWYRYLNCGYRLPCVGGTDKMGAWTPPGALRAYAYLGQNEFNMHHWADAVRRGNTFMTSGPLLLFHADGRAPGDEIALGAGGGSVEVQAEAKSYVDIHSLEVVFNGKVVAAREDRGGARQMTLKETIQVPGVGWLAARCASRPGPSVVWPYGIEAHTSPVYVRVPGQELFSASAAAYIHADPHRWRPNLGRNPGHAA
ncbi:MAG: hypothetical protein DMG24_18730 [Acidobacteria bacterium]|nr:MAG: hypothetical protein DMG24_18730 [Acidobacteriota bacterium]